MEKCSQPSQLEGIATGRHRRTGKEKQSRAISSHNVFIKRLWEKDKREKWYYYMHGGPRLLSCPLNLWLPSPYFLFSLFIVALFFFPDYSQDFTISLFLSLSPKLTRLLPRIFNSGSITYSNFSVYVLS